MKTLSSLVFAAALSTSSLYSQDAPKNLNGYSSEFAKIAQPIIESCQILKNEKRYEIYFDESTSKSKQKIMRIYINIDNEPNIEQEIILIQNSNNTIFKKNYVNRNKLKEPILIENTPVSDLDYITQCYAAKTVNYLKYKKNRNIR